MDMQLTTKLWSWQQPDCGAHFYNGVVDIGPMITPPEDVAACAKWVRTERTKRGLSAAQLADRARHEARNDGSRLVLTQQSISKFENGSPKRFPEWFRYAVRALEQYDQENESTLGATPLRSDLSGAPIPTGNLRTASRIKPAPGVKRPPDNNLLVMTAEEHRSVAVRRFDISYSMGPGTNIDDYVEDEPMAFDAQWLGTVTRSPADRLAVAQGAGDSMFPTLLDQDLMIFDTTQRVLNLQDRIWVCSINGAGAIKRLRKLNQGRVQVISDNPGHDNYEVAGEEIFLLGRLEAVIRKF